VSPVLAITENAAEIIQSIVGSSPEEVPGEPGLRIAARPEGEQRTAFELTIAAIPAEDDEVVEEHGAHVFLDPEAASYLEDKVLDARLEGDQVGFALLEQG
jgi:iron-sulfur cluster assembly protein